MGYTLSKYALGVAADPKMNNATRVVLWAMSEHAFDATGLYRKGHAVLAIALGHGADPYSDTAKRAVGRAVGYLIEMGVIEIVRQAAPRQAREYRFTHVTPPVDADG